MTSGKFKPRNTEQAKTLRNQATPAERLLWTYLSKGQLGTKISRQIPIGPYFVDFVSRSAQLVIELDGYSHNLSNGHDMARTRYLEALGFHVLRFGNDDVLGNVEGVVRQITLVLAEMGVIEDSSDLPTPAPSRKREGRKSVSPTRPCNPQDQA